MDDAQQKGCVVVIKKRCRVRGAKGAKVQRCTVHGAWCMVNGVWCMVHGAWCAVHGVWCKRGRVGCIVQIGGMKEGGDKGKREVSGC